MRVTLGCFKKKCLPKIVTAQLALSAGVLKMFEASIMLLLSLCSESPLLVQREKNSSISP